MERATAWRSWLLRLDPSGQWERRVRLGGRLTELEPGPRHLTRSARVRTRD
ncbi:DUF746 domain-containing protein [Burkholderia ubonensis]|uniref:DUF746 domain-containing protein n=1 Tax=Burkholderia ubonensis TaxID=101571 RepID=UPI001E2E687D|nr:DUF746 domain-containing protein [Burkholderia ubonensis]